MTEIVNSLLTITHLQIENVKRIQVATITPTPDGLEIIGGLNEQGKTSCLDAIEYLLAGAKSLPAEPLRRGAKKGRVYAELADGDLKVERRFTKNGSTLTVSAKDGSPYKSPQSILDRLYADHTFEPLGFLQLKPKAQVEMLRELVNLDFTEIDAERQRLYDERTGIKREVNLLEGQVAAIPLEDVALVETDALLIEIAEAESHNRKKGEVESLLARANDKLQSQSEQIERLQRELKEVTEAKNLQLAVIAEIEERLTDFAPIDIEPLRERLRDAGEINTKAREQVRRRELEKNLRSRNAEALKLTLRIDNLDAEKESQLSNAKFPVEGLAFSDDGVLYNGLPFEQASGEQQLLISAAMAAAQNPQLRVLLIRNGSLLDDHHLEVLRQWAYDNSIQVWLEKVTANASECSVIFENGLIKEPDGLIDNTSDFLERVSAASREFADKCLAEHVHASDFERVECVRRSVENSG